MTKTKSTKRALLTSALALLLCVSMLVGSTFAWFTDSVTSGSNIIQSGTLDVTMEWADGTKAVPADDSSDWTDASKGAIFKSELWEPGYTEVRHIKIANEGTLALKYQLNIIANGEVSELADVIDVYYVDPAVQVAERTALTDNNKLGTLSAVLEQINTTASGNLKAGEKDTITLALKMQETAGNEYQNKSIGSDFSIQLLATQLTSEFDSFNNQYDKDATYGSYIELEAGADLLAALKSAEADLPVTIKLNGNVEWPTEGHHDENDITPASSIVIDGNGYTITATGSGVTPLGDVEAPMTLKNVKIVDNSVSYAESAWEFTYLEMGGTKLNCENVTFADEIQFGTNATFTNCTFESNEESVYAVWVEAGSATFTNCIFTGFRGLKTHEDYGSEVKTVVVDNCTFVNITKKPGIAIGDLNADTTVAITNSTFASCQAGDQGLYIYETDTDVATFNFVNKNNVLATGVASDLSLIEALVNGDNAVLTGDVTIDKANLNSNGYGATGINLKAGQTLDGQGNVLNINGAGGTWDSGIATAGGVIKNITVTGAFRGVFVKNNTEKVILENVIIDGTTYTISCDSGKGAGLEATNCTFNGWTSFAKTIGNVKFTNCNFGAGAGYNYSRPYAPTTYVGCNFAAGHRVDARDAVTFENCTIDGQPLTAENLATLVTSNIVNATVIK